MSTLLTNANEQHVLSLPVLGGKSTIYYGKVSDNLILKTVGITWTREDIFRQANPESNSLG